MGKVHDIVIRPIRQWRMLNVAEIWFHRDLLLMLVIRSIKLRYKQTAIGLAWVVLQPLLSAMILAIVFGRLGGLPSEGAPYVLVVYTGMLPWIIISQTIQRGGVSIVSDRGLVTNIYFPRAILPIAHCLSVLVDYTVATLFMLILMMIYGQSFGWAILTLPVLTAVALLLAFGIVLVISAVNVYFRDVMHALPSLIQVLFYASPIAYTLTLVPVKWHGLYLLNPVAGLVEAYRWALLGGRDFPLLAVGMATLISAVLFVIGSLVFNRLERGFADVI